MQSNIEIEAKVLLTKDQYENLLKYLHLERYKKIEQTNHYIDSTNRVLKKSDIALRIRENNDFVLTLKTPLSEGLLEKNQNITWREYSDLEDNGIFPQGDIKNFLEICGFNTRELKVLASLKTSRIELELDDGVLCLVGGILIGTIATPFFMNNQHYVPYYPYPTYSTGNYQYPYSNNGFYHY